MVLRKRSPFVYVIAGIFGMFFLIYLLNTNHPDPDMSQLMEMFAKGDSKQKEIWRPPQPLDQAEPFSGEYYEQINLPDQQISETGELLSITGSSFAAAFSTFDWEEFKTEITKVKFTKTDIKNIEAFQEDLMYRLTPFLEMEPRLLINRSCIPPALKAPSDLKCEGHGNAFSGTQRSDPLPKIGILIQFGFGVDVLEIYLNEVYDVVDQFFIIESTKSHFRTLRKSLMWEKVKDQGRFRKFADKITHLVIDDAEAAKATQFYANSTKLIEVQKIWQMEELQETLRWTKFLQWNDAHKFFGPDDLIGFGDSDEIPSREILHMIRNCDLNGTSVDIGIWFPFGNIHQAFKTDFPVPGHPYTLGDPTFWTLKTAEEFNKTKKKAPGRMRGKSGKFLLGGMHMTHYGYLPYQLMRDISCTECAPTIEEMTDFAQSLKTNQIRDLEIRRGQTPKWNLNRTVKLNSIAEQMKEIAILPWFYDCNRLRYPVWEGGHDTRLD